MLRRYAPYEVSRSTYLFGACSVGNCLVLSVLRCKLRHALARGSTHMWVLFDLLGLSPHRVQVPIGSLSIAPDAARIWHMFAPACAQDILNAGTSFQVVPLRPLSKARQIAAKSRASPTAAHSSTQVRMQRKLCARWGFLLHLKLEPKKATRALRFSSSFLHISVNYFPSLSHASSKSSRSSSIGEAFTFIERLPPFGPLRSSHPLAFCCSLS